MNCIFTFALGKGENVNLKYTLAFLRSGDSVLMLYRYRTPNQYFWNGVGGKVVRGETPRNCVIREIYEETGVYVEDVRFSGIVTWEGAPETGEEGMYVYIADIPEGDSRRHMVPFDCDEGMLAWMPVEEVIRSVEVVDNIQHFLPSMLNGDAPKRWHCRYGKYSLESVEAMECPNL
jgi:8-oxo-dGTP diphosphatase